MNPLILYLILFLLTFYITYSGNTSVGSLLGLQVGVFPRGTWGNTIHESHLQPGSAVGRPVTVDLPDRRSVRRAHLRYRFPYTSVSVCNSDPFISNYLEIVTCHHAITQEANLVLLTKVTLVHSICHIFDCFNSML